MLHGVLREREFELYAFVAAILVVLVYCVIEYIVNAPGRNTVKLVSRSFLVRRQPIDKRGYSVL